jgi:ech hydrogenase subunit D
MAAFIETTEITQDTLKDEIHRLLDAGYRLETITCVDLDENTVDLLYHFQKNMQLIHLRMKQSKETNAPSISDVVFAAFLVENEIQDQFGLCFDGLALNFSNFLYLEEEVATTPFCKYGITRKES